MLRGGRSLVAIGDLAGFVVIAPGATIIVDYTIDEPGVLDRYVLDADVFGLVVTSINLDNDNLISGSVGASLFAPGNLNSPAYFHRVTQNTRLRVTLTNPTAAGIQCTHGFTVR